MGVLLILAGGAALVNRGSDEARRLALADGVSVASAADGAGEDREGALAGGAVAAGVILALLGRRRR